MKDEWLSGVLPERIFMGKTNDALNHFLKDNQEFADMINLSIYKGQKVVEPDDLS